MKKNSEKKVTYWSGIFAKDDAFSSHNAINEILTGGKLKEDKQIYSVRLDPSSSERILFTTMDIDNVKYFMLLDVIADLDLSQSKDSVSNTMAIVPNHYSFYHQRNNSNQSVNKDMLSGNATNLEGTHQEFDKIYIDECQDLSISPKF